MTIDFWVTLGLFVVGFLATTIMGFFIDPAVGMINMIPSLIFYALALWAQYCIRAGSCNVLAWILVAIYTLIVAFSIGAMIWYLVQMRRVKRFMADASHQRSHDAGKNSLTH